MVPSHLPVLGVCGFSNSGKTTLIEQLIPILQNKGLKVAVLKHDAHGIDVDRPGKDSDRFFRAGGDVLLQGPREELLRLHRSDDRSLADIIGTLSVRYDIILIEGHKGLSGHKIWLLGDGEISPPPEVTDIVEVLSRDCDRVCAITAFLDKWLKAQTFAVPVFGCVPIGGKSTRMGRPKHLICEDGSTWLQSTYNLLEQVTEQVVIVGSGEIPGKLEGCTRLPDVTDAAGPMAGLLAAMRWGSRVSWLVAACDLPRLSIESLQWLLASRSPGVWATLPKLPDSPGVEPLLAHYDYRSIVLLEALVAEGNSCPAMIAESNSVISPAPPEDLIGAWQNINTQREYRELHSSNDVI